MKSKKRRVDRSQRGTALKRLLDPQAGGIAAMALLIGLLNTAYQISQWLQGPELRLLPPEQILLIPDEYPTGQTYIRFATPVSYVNSGPPAQKAVILKEMLEYRVNDLVFEQKWQSFEMFSGRSCGLTSESSEDVRPVVISGRDSASHVTFFAPRTLPEDGVRYKNFHRLEDFLGDLETEETVLFELTAEVDEARTLVGRCYVTLDNYVKSTLGEGCSVTLPCFTAPGEAALG